MGLIRSPSGDGGIGQNSITSGWDLSEFRRERTGWIEPNSLRSGWDKKKKVAYTPRGHTHTQI